MSLPVWSMSHREFVKLPKEMKIQFLSAHIKFLKDVHALTETDLMNKKVFKKWNAFIAMAYADTGYDCFYAGWPSKTVNSNGRKLCSSPSNHNPHYATSETQCEANELKCQPLLFGSNLCADASTQSKRNSAFSQCEQKFQDSGKSIEQLVGEISSPEKGQMFNELFALVDEVCENGMQATKPMCTSLKQKVSALRALSPMIRPGDVEAELVGVVADVSGINQTVNNTLLAFTNCLPNTIPNRLTPPFISTNPSPGMINRDPSSTPYPRITREVDARCGSSRSGNGYSVLSLFNCSQNSSDENSYPNGFSFRSGKDHPLVDHLSSLYTDDPGKPYRQIEMESANHALNETFIYLIDSAGGPDSHDVKSMMFLIPRRTVPRVENIGDIVRMTLPTGETVDFDKTSNAVLGGALREGPMDLNTNRHQRTPPNVQYQGSGISIRLDHRYEYPTQGAVEATVTQGTKKCKVPRTRLFNAEGNLISQSDNEFLSAINSACQNQFSL